MRQLLPYRQLKLISIIDEVEIPLLMHYKDDEGNDLLRYIIDCENNSVQSIIWKCTENDLLSYLSNKITLKELILLDNKEFVFLASNRSVEGSDIQAKEIPLQEIPSDFLPSNNSYYGFGIPLNYQSLQPQQ